MAEVPVDPPAGVEPLPNVVMPHGVLFRIKAPNETDVFVVGSFNGWGTRNGAEQTVDRRYRMFGPDSEGIWEYFAPVSPGIHAFCFNIGGYTRIYGHPSMPKAKDYFAIQQTGTFELKGSVFQFNLTTPPWPPHVPNDLMIPVIVMHSDGHPYLRLRYYTRTARTVHVAGNWDDWAGGLTPDTHQMQPTRVPAVYEFYAGPLTYSFTMQYKIVIDKSAWIPDPSVVNTNEIGDTLINIEINNQQARAVFNPRFGANERRDPVENRWGGNLAWIDDRSTGFSKARDSKAPLLWVITLPGSKETMSLMQSISGDKDIETIAKSKNLILLETPAFEVRDILETQNITQLPSVVLVGADYRPRGVVYNPTIEELRKSLQEL